MKSFLLLLALVSVVVADVTYEIAAPEWDEIDVDEPTSLGLPMGDLKGLRVVCTGTGCATATGVVEQFTVSYNVTVGEVVIFEESEVEATDITLPTFINVTQIQGEDTGDIEGEIDIFGDDIPIDTPYLFYPLVFDGPEITIPADLDKDEEGVYGDPAIVEVVLTVPDNQIEGTWGSVLALHKKFEINLFKSRCDEGKVWKCEECMDAADAEDATCEDIVDSGVESVAAFPLLVMVLALLLL